MTTQARHRRILERKLQDIVKAKNEMIMTLENQVKQIESEIVLAQGGQIKEEQFKELTAKLDVTLDSLEQMNDSHGGNRENTVPKRLAHVEGDSAPSSLVDSGMDDPTG